MKLYFMIGLPTEEESDVREIVQRRQARARRRQARPQGVERGRAAQGHRQRLDARAQAAHAVPVVRDGPRGERPREAGLAPRRGARAAASSSACTTRARARARGRLRARRSQARCDVLERAYRSGRALRLVGRPAARSTCGSEAFAARGHRAGDVPRHHPGDRAAAVEITSTSASRTASCSREYRKALKSRLSPPCGKVAGAFVHHTNLEDARRTTRKLVCYDCGVACDLSAMRDERMGYLVKLGAKTKRVAEGEARRRRSTPRASRARPAAARSCRARRAATASRSRRSGRCAFLSHLDLIRALPRSFRRDRDADLLLVGLPPEARL